MKRRTKAAIAAVSIVLGLTGQAASAAPPVEPLVATFVHLCGDTGADADAALAAADAAGWKTPPKPAAPPPAAAAAATPHPTGRRRGGLHPANPQSATAQSATPPSASPQAATAAPPSVVPPTADLQYRSKLESTRQWALSVGTFAGAGDARLRSCTVAGQAAAGAPPLDLAAVRQSVQDWAGVPPLAGHDAAGMVVFAFIDGQQGHEALPPTYDPLTNNDVKVAGVVVISLISFRDVSMVVYQTDDR